MMEREYFFDLENRVYKSPIDPGFSFWTSDEYGREPTFHQCQITGTTNLI